jgi:hypothetical protein
VFALSSRVLERHQKHPLHAPYTHSLPRASYAPSPSCRRRSSPPPAPP